MFIASVEARDGDRLIVLSREKLVVGEMLINFLLSMNAYCKGDLESRWLRALEPYFEKQLCDTIHPLLRAHYSGYWEYEEDEYEFFIKRMGEVPISEEEFKRTIQEVRSMWTDVYIVRDILTELLAALEKAHLDPVGSFYEPPQTEDEIRGLLETVELLIGRNVEEIRIAFV